MAYWYTGSAFHQIPPIIIFIVVQNYTVGRMQQHLTTITRVDSHNPIIMISRAASTHDSNSVIGDS